MKKRIVCVLLTLIMLMSLVPMSAFAAGNSTSEAAVTVLKQLEGYITTCNGNGYTGYGTLCTEKGTHGSHKINEKLADKALRAELKELDAAINSFATKKGLNLSQNQHDALVLFSFENGTAWTTGTGSFQAAVASRKTGSEFLNAICWWDTSIADDDRRMVEANMYLNGVYSSSKPSQFIRVTYNVNGGYIYEGGTWWWPFDDVLITESPYMAQACHQYYDVTKAQDINVSATNQYHTFMGWYTASDTGEQVTSLTAGHHGVTLYAHWQEFADEPGVKNVSYNMYAKDLASTTVYTQPNGTETRMNATGYIEIDSEFIDDNGNRWGRVVDSATGNAIGWVKLKVVKASASDDIEIDVTVTVTNSYVNSRVNASVNSAKNGSYNQGAQLRIIKKVDGSDGFVWGQVAKSATDNTPVGWIALMYTNFESVRNQDVVSSTKAIAKATITFRGYVNVRSDAGTDNQIVGALSTGTTVDLYATKYVNGIQWGRCKTGWFCLSYAEVTQLVEDKTASSDIGFTTYIFTGVLDNSWAVYKAPGSDEVVRTKTTFDPNNITITNLTATADGITWGKIPEGWVKVSNADGSKADVTLDVAKFVVSAANVTVRTNPNTDSARVDTLVQGVEFNVNQSKQVVVVGETIWGYADKVGEASATYGGWVNLANKNVTRNGAPAQTNSATGLIATVTGTNSVNVRISGSTSAQQVGKLSLGTTAVVLEEKDGWYNLDVDVDGNPETGSWVYGGYLSIREDANAGTNGGNGSSNGTAAVETGTGIVANTYSGVNVRTGPSTGYGINGKLLPGTEVEILEVTTTGTTKWGRVTQGWICMDYVTMISNYPIAGTTNNNGAANNSGNATTTTETAIYTGTTKQEVNIRKTTSLTADIVRTVPAGAPITMHEIVTVVEEVTTTTNNSNTGATTTTTEVTSYWARVNDGYIYAPANHLNLDTLDEHTYTMTGSDTLNVRKTAGSKNKPADDVLFKLEKGDQVTITKLEIVNGNVWGFVECENDNGQLQSGWASLAYMTKGAVAIQQETVAPETTAPTTPPPVIGNGSSTGGYVTNSSGYRYTGKVINTDQVNVRTYASANNATSPVTTTLKRGESLVIYETTISENMAWGRCDAGWVYLYYVDLTPVTGAVDARVVYNENTIIYTDMNCSGVAGTYSRMSVIDIYEVVGKMARTELGWVNTDNLL